MSLIGVVKAALGPDWRFEKSWAATLLDQVWARLRNEFETAGKEELFEQLKLFVWAEKLAGTRAELAGEKQRLDRFWDQRSTAPKACAKAA